MRTDYLTPDARHERHRYQRATAALHRLLGPRLAEQIMEGEVPIEDLPKATPRQDDPDPTSPASDPA